MLDNTSVIIEMLNVMTRTTRDTILMIWRENEYPSSHQDPGRYPALDLQIPAIKVMVGNVKLYYIE